MIEIAIPLIIIENLMSLGVIITTLIIGYYIIRATIREHYLPGIAYIVADLILLIATIIVTLNINHIVEIRVVTP